MARRLLTVALLFFVSPLRVLVSSVSLSTGPVPDGVAAFTVDPFGSLIPNDRSQRLSARTFIAQSNLALIQDGSL